MDSDKNGYLD
jgi:Ca2+-binding EF-hand superfamily protein